MDPGSAPGKTPWGIILPFIASAVVGELSGVCGEGFVDWRV
ncbi:hypothetical protein PsW64_05293 [Pseudovibrio sp. W64]|nr:hypothetical protein PsW64_05293 [Pseudovibrio sp. W64]